MVQGAQCLRVPKVRFSVARRILVLGVHGLFVCTLCVQAVVDLRLRVCRESNGALVVCQSVSGARLLLFGQEGEALQALLTLLLKDIVQFCAKNESTPAVCHSPACALQYLAILQYVI